MILKATELLLEDVLVKPILVVCPACNQKASVIAKDFSASNWKPEQIRVVCSSCSYHKELKDFPTQIIKNSAGKTTPIFGYTMGATFDPFFRIPLYLQTKCSGELLWAYNEFHLEILEEYIAAKLRNRSSEAYLNRSIASRLPKWMTSSGNRVPLLKALSLLKKKL